MPTVAVDRGPDLLGWWIERTDRKTAVRAARRESTGGQGLRFAFYGRMSTEDFQDRVTSGCWQREFAEELVAGHGRIVAEFFDTGWTRAWAWHRRPEAAKLVAALANPDRGWEAVVIGEFERAFCGDQFLDMAPVFESFGVPVWVPELGGPADIHNDMHLSLLHLLGVHSLREVQRARFRSKAAMRAQVIEQGRFLGGRPPYGYMIADAGPHPNRAHAASGRRAHCLAPDPVTAPWVTWIFAQRLTGRSVAAITRALNDQGVPCPSGHDSRRNPHRTGAGWTLRSVASLLANPRYTGRQVWNRQTTELGCLDDADDLLGRSEVARWNQVQQWTVSKAVAHAALISEEDFVAAQDIHTAPQPHDGRARRFRLSGILACEPCGRALDAHWSHGRPAYRCRHGRSSAKARWERPLGNIYAREDQALIFLTRHLPKLGYDSDPLAAVTDRLEDSQIVIFCDYGSWRLEVDGHVIAEECPPRMAPEQKKRIPRQRGASIEAVGK